MANRLGQLLGKLLSLARWSDYSYRSEVKWVIRSLVKQE